MKKFRYIAVLALASLMCLTACGAETEADSSSLEGRVAEEVADTEGLTVYFVLDSVSDEMTSYKINSGRYYISVDQAAVIAAEEDFVFVDADGNVITVVSDGSYSADTGKALLKVVGTNGVFADTEDQSVTIAVTEIAEGAEEEAEDETEEEEEEDKTETSEETVTTAASSGSTQKSTSKSSTSSTTSVASEIWIGKDGTVYSSAAEMCAADGHTWDSGELYYPDGECTVYTRYTCETCGKTKLEVAIEDYHTWVITSKSVTVGYRCYCGDEFDTYDELEAHWWTDDCYYYSNAGEDTVFNYIGFWPITEQVQYPECSVCGFTCTYEEYLEIISTYTD